MRRVDGLPLIVGVCGLALVVGSLMIGLDPELGWWVLDVDPSLDGYAGIPLPPAVLLPAGLVLLAVGVGGVSR